jgi:hypothetical protein
MLMAAAVWFRLWEPFAEVSVLGLVGTVAGGWPIFQTAWTTLRERRMTMELSMTIALAAALLIGEFLTALVIAAFVLIAEVLEDLTVGRGRRAIRDLLDYLPAAATVRRAGAAARISLGHVQTGDIVLVAPGERLPVDGTVRTGHSYVDQATITGESQPVEKISGSVVCAGTINQSGALEVVTERVGRDTSFGKIVEAVERAERSQAPVQKTADRYATRRNWSPSPVRASRSTCRRWKPCSSGPNPPAASSTPFNMKSTRPGLPRVRPTDAAFRSPKSLLGPSRRRSARAASAACSWCRPRFHCSTRAPGARAGDGARVSGEARADAFRAVLCGGVAALRATVLERRAAAERYRLDAVRSATEIETHRPSELRRWRARHPRAVGCLPRWRVGSPASSRPRPRPPPGRDRARICHGLGDPVMRRTLRILCLALLAASALTGCGRRAGDAADETALPTLDVTNWTDQTELFMEYPALVAGQTALFAVHLTTLADFKAVTAGRASVEFTPEAGGAPTRLLGPQPSRPGVFRVSSGTITVGSPAGITRAVRSPRSGPSSEAASGPSDAPPGLAPASEKAHYDR